MTPAVVTLQAAGVDFTLHEYAHARAETHYGDEAAHKLNIPPERVFKTLIIELDSGQLATAILPVSKQLNLKLTAKALGAKKARMAEPKAAEKITGYVLGGVSPIGQKKLLATVVDASITSFPTVFVSGGKRGLELELKGQVLIDLICGVSAMICNPGAFWPSN